jgi:hypothetical protein
VTGKSEWQLPSRATPESSCSLLTSHCSPFTSYILLLTSHFSLFTSHFLFSSIQHPFSLWCLCITALLLQTLLMRVSLRRVADEIAAVVVESSSDSTPEFFRNSMTIFSSRLNLSQPKTPRIITTTSVTSTIFITSSPEGSGAPDSMRTADFQAPASLPF